MMTEPEFPSTPDDPNLVHLKEIKLQLPLRTHVRLRAEKLLRGDTIAATVNAAVSAYFERHPIRDILAFDANEATT